MQFTQKRILEDSGVATQLITARNGKISEEVKIVAKSEGIDVEKLTPRELLFKILSDNNYIYSLVGKEANLRQVKEKLENIVKIFEEAEYSLHCLLYTSPSPRDRG